MDRAEQERILQSGTPEEQSRLARRDDVAEDIQHALALESSGYAMLLAGNHHIHPSLQESFIERYENHGDDNSHFFNVLLLGANPNLVESLQERHLNLGASASSYLPSNPILRSDLRKLCVLSEDPSRRRSAAQNPMLTPEEQLLLSHDSNAKYALANNPSLTPEIRAQLIKDPDCHLGLAANPSTSQVEQMVLWDIHGEDFAGAFAENPNIHPDLAVHLSQQDGEAAADLANNLKEWTPTLCARFVHAHKPDLLKEWTSRHPWDDVEALAATWRGNVLDLLEALDLTR